MNTPPPRLSENSSLPPEENAGLETFVGYLDSLEWGPGERDRSAWCAFLRAGSLGVDPKQAAASVVERIRATGGTVNAGKIQSQLRRAYEHVGSSEGTIVGITKTPKFTFSPEKLKRMAAKVEPIEAGSLKAHSPVPPGAVTSEEFLSHLYEPGEQVLIFTTFESQGQHLHVVGQDSHGSVPTGAPEGVWFLNQPVDGEFHSNPRQGGKLSRRSEESVTAWRYLVLESDVAQANDWLACLVQLPLKIVAIYTSGGKSVHALVRLDASTKAEWDRLRDKMKPIVVTLGADENALTAVRLTRLPGAMRGDRLQELLYLDPAADGTPIITRTQEQQKSSEGSAHE